MTSSGGQKCREPRRCIWFWHHDASGHRSRGRADRRHRRIAGMGMVARHPPNVGPRGVRLEIREHRPQRDRRVPEPTPSQLDLASVVGVAGGARGGRLSRSAPSYVETRPHVVVMNADGSAGVDASLVRVVRLSNAVAALWGVLAFGAVGGELLVLRGIGKPETEPSDVARDVHRENGNRGWRRRRVRVAWETSSSSG